VPDEALALAVLDFIQKDVLLSNALALKGGTAINLTIFNLPRLSQRSLNRRFPADRRSKQ